MVLKPTYLDIPANYFSIENLKKWLDENEIPGKIIYDMTDMTEKKRWKLVFDDPGYATLFQLKWNYHGQ